MPPKGKNQIPRTQGPSEFPSDYRRRRTAKKTSPSSMPVPPMATAASPSGMDEGDARYAPTTWGTAAGTFLEDLVVPSGQLCQVRRPGVEGLIQAGVLNDLDSLTAIVDNKHVKRALGQKQIDASQLKIDGKMIENIMHVTDRIVCYVVVQPRIEMTPNDPTRRESGVIYADMVDLQDKMFILNYAVGGTRDLERFRGELAESVRSLDDGEDVESSSE